MDGSLATIIFRSAEEFATTQGNSPVAELSEGVALMARDRIPADQRMVQLLHITAGIFIVVIQDDDQLAMRPGLPEKAGYRSRQQGHATAGYAQAGYQGYCRRIGVTRRRLVFAWITIAMYVISKVPRQRMP